MSEPTYETVAPLVDDVQTHRRTVTVRFTCRRSGESVQARATVPEGVGSAAMSRVGQSVKRSLMWSLRSSIASLVRGVFGHGIVGRTASDLVYAATNEATRVSHQRADSLSQDEVQAGIVAAFASVRGRFVWDAERGEWVSASAAAELMSAFQRQLAQHPATHPYDRQVLARMLVEVARADGRVAAEEQTWLTELIGPDQGSLAQLAQRPPLTAAELSQTSHDDVRVSLLTTAWALALVDERFDPGERSLLERWGQGLGLRPAQVAKARDAAAGHLLDEALERMHAWGGHDAHARQELYALAARMGISRQAAEQAEAAFQRRRAR